MYYNKSVNELLMHLNTSLNGLASEEAALRQEKYGKNILKEDHEVSKLKILLNQLKSFIVYILILAAIISFIFNKFTDSLIILIIVILNTILGYVQEYKAEKSIQALKKLTEPTTLVMRDGKEQTIFSSELVPGDLIIIEAGSRISADARIIGSSSLQVDESTLTGESTPVDKIAEKLSSDDVSLSDQKNMLFSGTIAVYGRAKAIVVSTAMNTELGKVAKLIQETPESTTPLQKRLKSFGVQITFVILFFVAIIFLIGYLRSQQLIEMFISSLSLVVAAVPEGLPAIITITLALGTQRMLKRNALIRKLSAVESLGAVDIICADKTGTLTKNEMTATKIFINKKLLDAKEINATEVKKLIEVAVLCNNATEQYASPTEKALLELAKKTKLNFNYPRTSEIPFASEKKYMVTVNRINNKNIAYMKGAPEVVIEHCKYIHHEGRLAWLTSSEKKMILEQAEKMAGSALRVLGFAYSRDNEPKDMVFVGLIGMIDPPREEVIEAVSFCKKAGIKTIMITGDHELTARAIASQIGIEGNVLTGKQLDKLKPEQFRKLVENVAIYARVSPKHKIRIVTALQERGHIVAMTGDGVNDAPALKKSDIGVAVGSGTDVAKEASEMIILDNSFHSIVEAVKEGRRIFSNIKKFILYLFSSNFGEFLTVFLALLFSPFMPLLAIHILWINLVTDGLPALALGVDPISSSVVNNPPRKKKDGILNKFDFINIFLISIIMAAGALILFKYYLAKYDLIYAQTIAFTALVLFQMFNVLNYRADGKTIFSKEFYQNKYLLGAILISVALQIILIYFFTGFFQVVVLSLFDWLLVIAVSSSVLFFQEILKLSRKFII